MDVVGDGFRLVHVVFGFIGLGAFWIPVFSKKGAANHVRFGKIFVWSAYILLSAAAVALGLRIADAIRQGIGLSDEPSYFAFLVFLGYLTLVTFVIVRHGVGVLRNKREPRRMHTILNRFLAMAAVTASIAIVLYALIVAPPNRILLFALSPIGISSGLGILRYINSEAPSRRAWMYEHMGAMLGGGIAFHTAFAVFGSSRLFDIGLEGWVAVIPWVAPAAIGIPAIVLWTRHYRRKFNEPVAA